MATKKKTTAGWKPKHAKTLSSTDIRDLLKDISVNIHGHPDSGKTWGALSLSKDWPKNPLILKKPVILSDVLHIGWDKSAVIGAAAHKIRPKYYIDVPATLMGTNEMDCGEAMEAVVDEIYNVLDNDPNINIVLHDTITRMDKYLLSYWFTNAEKWETEDTRKMYGCVGESHRRYQNEVMQVPAGVTNIFLFHEKIHELNTKGKSDTVAANKARHAQKTMASGEVNTIPDITGQSLNVYTSDASLELATKVIRGAKGKKTYVFKTDIKDGQRTKNRFGHLLDAQEPTDLKAIFAKLEKAAK